MELTYQEVYHMNPVQARKRIIHIYQQTQNYCETARRCHTSPQLVRKWVQRYQQYGEQGLHDLPKTPKRQPRKTDTDTEQRVLQLHQKTHYGRQRLARHLAQHGIHLSPNTIRHILRRHAPATSRPRKQRRRFYPAHWAWESQEPFTLIQADVKDIYDKGTLGTERWDHLRKHRLPRYQWTFLESRTRLRLLAFSREISTLHGMAFLSLAVSWLRLCGVPTEMTIQTDWGEEWGGSNPDKIARLEAEFLRPLGARLGRIPLGRKEYNGRVERSHRTDDEEFYLPCVLSLDTVEAFLGAGLGWLYYYNYERVHSGYGMAGRTPYGCCVALGFSGSEYVGLMPVVLLDNIVLEWSRHGVPAVNDVLAHYTVVNAPTHRLHPPLLLILYPHSKKKKQARLLQDLSHNSHNRRHAKVGQQAHARWWGAERWLPQHKVYFLPDAGVSGAGRRQCVRGRVVGRDGTRHRRTGVHHQHDGLSGDPH
jgi:putative transposase